MVYVLAKGVLIISSKNNRTPTAARPQDIGAVVRRIRESAGLGVGALADAAGINRRTVLRLERDGAASVDTICSVERALGLTAGTLVPSWDVAWTTRGDTPGARMRLLRKRKGWKLKDAAEWLELAPATLSRMERGIGDDLENRWRELISRYRFDRMLGFRTYDDMEAYLEGETAFFDPPRG